MLKKKNKVKRFMLPISGITTKIRDKDNVILL